MKNIIIGIACGALFIGEVEIYLSQTKGTSKNNTEENVLFRGVPSDLVLCEGDSVELRVREGKLIVDCADRRKIPVIIMGAGGTVSNLDLNCLVWCQYLMSVRTQSTVTISNSIFSNSAIFEEGIRTNEQISKEK